VASIETYVVPRYLYRYRPIARFDREMKAIETGYLYCSNYKAMNDPMEDYYSASKLLERSSDIKATRDAIGSGKRAIGICSFSEVFDHELMWAHYADKFQGICVAYDFFSLRRYLPPDVSFSRVYYNEEAPEVGRSRFARDPNEIAKTILSYKNYRWLYEREWRMFANIGAVEYTNSRCVARVYIGWRVRRRHEIERRLRLLKIPCKLQKLDGYVMNFERTMA
jgi:Protein of unknown function (DUF2971)